MPDDNVELTVAQVQELKDNLMHLEKELLRLSIEGVQSETVSLDESIGRLARVDAMQHQKMAKKGTDQHKLRLAKVQAALRTFEKKTYGDCRSCEECIGYNRLRARPEAVLCIACKNEEEQ